MKLIDEFGVFGEPLLGRPQGLDPVSALSPKATIKRKKMAETA
jgi:hypothetical protein